MSIEHIQHYLEQYVSGERLKHVYRVTDMAIRLAEQHGISVEKAQVAALLHDIAKQLSSEELKAWIEKGGQDEAVLTYHKELWHAKAGAVMVEQDLSITDATILQAIRYHTTGREGMTCLEQIIYIADLIEEGRIFPGVERLRSIAMNRSLEETMAACIHHSVSYLIQQQTVIHPDSFACYNDWMKKNEGK